MKFVDRANLNEELWESWCSEADPGMFSCLGYLDEVSENVVFLLNEQETGGIALPFKKRLGVTTLYTPKFMRYSTWVGKGQPTKEELTECLQKRFSAAEWFAFDKYLTSEPKFLMHQLKQEVDGLRSQARRRLKEATKHEFQLEWSDDLKEACAFIKDVLLEQIPTLNAKDFDLLHRLAEGLFKKDKLAILRLKRPDEEKYLGYQLVLKDSKRWIFLKGACEHKVKGDGGMYMMMNTIQQKAFENGAIFDFGGSRHDGIRKFNKSFGSEDVIYYHYSWNNAPMHFRLIKYFRDKWKKK